MYRCYGNYVSLSSQIFLFAVAQILKVWPKALTHATQIFECGAKKALGQLVLLD